MNARADSDATGGRPAKTIGTVISFLSTVCRWAVQKGWRPSGPNPCKEFSRGRYVPRTEHVAPGQLRVFLDAVHDAEREASMWWREPARSIIGRAPYVLFRLLLVTGARPSELRTATWDEVDLDAKVIRRPTSKTGVPRRVALNEQACYVLAQWRLLLGTHADTRGLKHVFPSLRNPAGFMRDYRKAWAHIRKVLDGLRTYDLRRTFAVMAIESGATLEDTAAALGHGPGVLDRCYVPHAARPGAHRAARDAGERMRRHGATKERLG